MNATPLLARVVAALREQGLEAVLIGNAAAAIHGAPLLVASLDDVIASKEAAGRDRDLAVLSVLKQTRDALSGGAATPQAGRKPRRRGGRSM